MDVLQGYKHSAFLLGVKLDEYFCNVHGKGQSKVHYENEHHDPEPLCNVHSVRYTLVIYYGLCQRMIEVFARIAWILSPNEKP